MEARKASALAFSTVPISKPRIRFDIFLCLYPLVRSFPKCSETFRTVVTSSSFPLLWHEISSSQSLPDSWFSLPKSSLHLLFKLAFHSTYHRELPQWLPLSMSVLSSTTFCNDGNFSNLCCLTSIGAFEMWLVRLKN